MANTKSNPNNLTPLADAIPRVDPYTLAAAYADPRPAQALRILDALDALATPGRSVHLARDNHGVYVVRVLDDAEGGTPEHFRGASTRDALSQAVQAHPEVVS